MAKSKRKRKQNRFIKALTSPYVWFIQVFVWGLVIGIPFFMNGKSFFQFISEIKSWQGLIAIIGVALGGVFIEYFLKKTKLIR